MSILSKIFGDGTEKYLKSLDPLVKRVNSLEDEMKILSNDELKARTVALKNELTGGRSMDELLPEAFALTREAARRSLGQRHFDVQLLGGIILHQGKIAEMKTGEGKTLVATLPAYLNALSGKGVHIITVNDYLARRDAVWMGQIYALLGLTVSVLNHESSFMYDGSHVSEGEDEKRDETGNFRVSYQFLRPVTRKEAYLADITYGTNHEFGFDYLRDNLAYSSQGLVQREDFPHSYAIVDEIDSILIDEARTPLIISSPVAESEDLYKKFAQIAARLVEKEDYDVDEKLHAITLSEKGIEKTEKFLGVENIYTDKGIKYVHHLETAVRAKALFHLDKDYVIKNGEAIIVDQSTGRLQPGRRWSEGLHQAIEAKEGVHIKEESRTFASVSFQNYFRLYSKLSGMTGTAKTSAEEFTKVYGLETFCIPTNRENKRQDLDDLIFQTEAGKLKAIVAKIKELNEKGQPVLVGTPSIQKNEILSLHLSRQGISHEVLNAKNHEREGEIIAQAGRKGGVFVATNMAGRGVDIKLGGAEADNQKYEEVKNIGGLFVLGTERHEARRIDNQLRGRSGRQGDPGTTQFFVSLEDSLMRVFASDTIKNMMGRFGIPEDEPIYNRLVTKSIESAQEKIEGFHFDARKHLLEYDDVMNHQRKIIYDRRRKILLGDEEYLKNFLKEIEALPIDRPGAGDAIDLEGARRLSLQVIDMFWVEHLEVMDYMQSSVRLRAYGQRDPLVEYRKEGLRLFRDLEANIFAEIKRMLESVGTAEVKAEELKLEEVHRQASLIGGETGNVEDKPAQVPIVKPAAGRNDPCPCGSGKKYKKCHGV